MTLDRRTYATVGNGDVAVGDTVRSYDVGGTVVAIFEKLSGTVLVSVEDEYGLLYNFVPEHLTLIEEPPMSAVGTIISELSTLVKTKLTSSGATPTSLADGIAKALDEISNHPTATAAKIIETGAEIAFPEAALGIEIFAMLQGSGLFKPAEPGSLTFTRRSEDPADRDI